MIKTSMLDWIKRNKLASFLLVILLVILVKSLTASFLGFNTMSLSGSGSVAMPQPLSGVGLGAPSYSKAISDTYYPAQEYTPQTDVANRMVVQESNLSLLVKNVVEIRNKIVDFAQQNGGYMVNSTTSNPQDAPTAKVVIRVASDKLQEALDFFHSLSIKVVSENLYGTDVTDQYVDVEKRISLLESTISKYQEILSKATEISDITNLTREILSIQSQIDSLKGSQESLKQNASLAKLTVYLSTDEIALPYAPSETFRPEVIFKLAVRSLVGLLRQLATMAIWIGVYAVIWVPVALVGYLVYRKIKKLQV